MEKDVVCGMQVDPAKAAGSSELNGKNVTTSARKAAKQSSTRIPGNSSSSAPALGGVTAPAPCIAARGV